MYLIGSQLLSDKCYDLGIGSNRATAYTGFTKNMGPYKELSEVSHILFQGSFQAKKIFFPENSNFPALPAAKLHCSDLLTVL